MNKIILSLIIWVLCTEVLPAQPFPGSTGRTDKVLTQKIQNALMGFRGQAGVYVRNLRTNHTVEINADTIFPTASMVKIPILCGVFDKLERGELRYDQMLTYRDSLHYDDGIVGSLRDSAQIPLSYVLVLMETFSDNTGSLWLQALAGGGSTINAWLQAHGYDQTRVNSRTPGRVEAQKTYGWGQTTPLEMAGLLTSIYEDKVFSPAASERMYRLLGRTITVPDSARNPGDCQKRGGRSSQIGGSPRPRPARRLYFLHYHQKPNRPAMATRQRRKRPAAHHLATHLDPLRTKI